MATQTQMLVFNNNNTVQPKEKIKRIDSIKINKKAQVKRPMNAFMLWSKQKRREISRRDPSLHNAQISKLLGEEWKMLTSQDKLPYVEESQKLMLKHKEEHPEYRYKPRQNKMTKNMKEFSTYTPSLVVHSRDKMKCLSDYRSRYRQYERHSAESQYLSRSGICKIPGCYECHISAYERPYEKSYFYARHIYDMPSPCSCCRPISLSPSSDVSKRSSSFSVEDIMKSNKKSHSGSTSEDDDVTREENYST